MSARPPFDPWHTSRAVFDVLAATASTAEGLQRLQQQRLARLLAAAGDVPLHAGWIAGRDPQALRLADAPVLHKADLMRDFGRSVSDPGIRLDDLRRFVADPARIASAYLGRYVVWESSGSSGEPCIFVQDAEALAVYDAIEALRGPAGRWRNPAAGLWMGRRVAFVGATGGHFASTVSIERLRRLNPWLAGGLASFDFLDPIGETVAALNALQPDALATYPSEAVRLAGERRAGRLRIAPREVWTGGETLTPAQRGHVEQAFGCSVWNSYGASEFLSLAFECPHHRLHLNSDWAILESVDAGGAAVPPGHFGQTALLTNLANHVQPLIRYDLGDQVAIDGGRCRCGSPLPTIQVSGRCDDILMLAGRDGTPVAIAPLALSTVIEEEGGLFDFLLVQHGPRALTLNLQAQDAAAGRRCRDAVAAFLAAQDVAAVRIRCRAGATAVRGRSGKCKRIVAAAASPRDFSDR